jgi:magnesium-transporting ATPase (P-type)
MCASPDGVDEMNINGDVSSTSSSGESMPLADYSDGLSYTSYMDSVDSIVNGLTTTESAKLLSIYGHNELEQEASVSFISHMVDQIKDDRLVKILLLGSFISILATIAEGEISGIYEPLVVVLVLVMNAFIGAWQVSK